MHGWLKSQHVKRFYFVYSVVYKTGGNIINNKLKRAISDTVAHSHSGSMSRRVLMESLSIDKRKRVSFIKTLKEMVDDGELKERNGQYSLAHGGNTVQAEIVKLSGNFGFARELGESEQEYFIPGRDLKGALVGDKVLLTFRKGAGSLPDGRVLKILEESNNDFSGVVRKNEYGYYLEPDHVGVPFKIVKGGLMGAKEGDKVRACIEDRGDSHRTHQVRVIMCYGASDQASICAEAILADHDVDKVFPKIVEKEASEILQQVSEAEMVGRADLREKLIFTIDASESKDLDDAISLEKIKEEYLLGVHIADVSHYVQAKHPLDEEAYQRGTSVYYADQVVPMLPKLLSNGICSLNPNEDRLAFTAWMRLSPEGDLLSYRFEKSVIRSSLKGIYKEVNAVLDGSATNDIEEKYALLKDTLKEMEDLAKKRMKIRQQKGGFDLDTSESKIVVGADGITADIVRRERGFSEHMIEEFMLLANESAARFGREKEIPFLYRIHEKPAADRVDDLAESLRILGISEKEYQGELSQREIQSLLKKVKGTPYQEALQYRILRTMAKARYVPEPVGHYGLSLDDYTHFTSPIRRYPDLAIHRIMSDVLSGKTNNEALHKRYDRFVVQASRHSSDREVAAMSVERECEDCYKAEYMKQFIGKTMDTKVVGFASHAMYVELPNTVEGRIDFADLPAGNYVLDGSVRLRDTESQNVYNIGTPMRVVLMRADVSSGQIDFCPEETANSLEKKAANSNKRTDQSSKKTQSHGSEKRSISSSQRKNRNQRRNTKRKSGPSGARPSKTNKKKTEK